MQDIDIIATYSDASGHIRLARLKMTDLSDSWLWENPKHHNYSHGGMEDSLQTHSRFEDNLNHSTYDEHYPEENLVQIPYSSPLTPVKIKRRVSNHPNLFFCC
jgi:alpha-1,4-galacturonosyltransferase